MRDLSPVTRQGLWQHVTEAIEAYQQRVQDHPVAPRSSSEALRARLGRSVFQEPIAPDDALNFVVEGLWSDQMHVGHPRYFGLFNPAPTPASIAADALVAAFNPQMATWHHSPFAVEAERHLIQQLGQRLGFDPERLDGTFCTGGAEANHTAILTAITRQFPEFPQRGLRALDAQPVLYISHEGHHSIHKAARLCGLGSDAVREVALDEGFRLDVHALADQIARHRREGFAPFLVVATAGTTSGGTIDPIAELAELAQAEGLWLHVDGAWGGAVGLVPDLQHHLDGLNAADSLTLDAHKWLSVPMGAGIYFTQHPDILLRTFRTSTAYMPTLETELAPYARSIQWSRRFIGLKVFLSLAVSGWPDTCNTIRQMMDLGQFLRQELAASGWDVINPTPLPLACFQDGRSPEGRTLGHLERIAQAVVASGSAWISTTRLGGSTPVLRACITNYRTTRQDVRTLVEALEHARDRQPS